MTSLSQFTSAIADKNDGVALYNMLKYVFQALNSLTVTSGALVIKAGGSALAKVGAAYYGLVDGKQVTKAADTDMAALSGTVSNAAFNVFVFSVDADGDLSTTMGTEGASLAAVGFPTITGTIIGYAIINPTGTGDFVGGTTVLDDATVVPNAVYVNTVGAFAPKLSL